MGRHGNHIKKNEEISRNKIIKKLINARYERNDVELVPGNFRVKGDTIDVIPAYSQDIVRISLFGDEIERITILDNVGLDIKKQVESFKIFPAKHYLIAKDIRDHAVKSIKTELKDRLSRLPELERQRLEMRTKYDLEMIEELGYCSGIENYSRHFDGRSEGEPAFCLLDFYGKEFLLVIDESHVTLPQLHGMYKGDYSRKKSLIEYGFRLPSAFDNRPLKFEEFEKKLKDVIFVSATPGDYEKNRSKKIVEQLVRPTGLIDPVVEIRKSEGQMDDLIKEVTARAKRNERTLVTTLTKRMAEDLAEYLSKREIRVRYLHSEIEGLQRTELIRQLRLGEFDVLVGINLLREGLDIPEVSLVAILDADKEGFLRNNTSLVQTFGRAARNSEGKVIMYADNITKSMKSAISETERRRQKQIEYNEKNKIIPKTIIKSIPEQETELDEIKNKSKTDLGKQKIEIEMKMKTFAEDLDFENAIKCRDKIKRIEKELQKDESE